MMVPSKDVMSQSRPVSSAAAAWVGTVVVGAAHAAGASVAGTSVGGTSVGGVVAGTSVAGAESATLPAAAAVLVAVGAIDDEPDAPRPPLSLHDAIDSAATARRGPSAREDKGRGRNTQRML